MKVYLTVPGIMIGGFSTVSWAGSILLNTVKVTPLGGQDGEFCRLDRALIFEDLNGTRILHDAGLTVAGPDDSRPGKIDTVLLSHVQGDEYA